MDWFYNLLSEKCAPFIIGQDYVGRSTFCSAADSETLWVVALVSFISLTLAGGTALVGWKKWQKKKGEK